MIEYIYQLRERKIIMQQIIIIDDIEEHIKKIKECIEMSFKSFHIIFFKYPEQTIDDIELFPDNTIFILDIQLLEKNGIDLAKQIHKVCKNAQIIFSSSYLKNAPDVYEVEHCYFVYKPELQTKLLKAINKALENISESNKIITFHLKDKIKIVNIDNIFYIERNQRYSYICTNDDIIKTQTSLDELKSKLPNYFIRSHNSYIFNAKYLLEIKRTNIILKNNYNIPISRAYKQSVKEELHDFFIDSL